MHPMYTYSFSAIRVNFVIHAWQCDRVQEYGLFEYNLHEIHYAFLLEKHVCEPTRLESNRDFSGEKNRNKIKRERETEIGENIERDLDSESIIAYRTGHSFASNHKVVKCKVIDDTLNNCPTNDQSPSDTQLQRQECDKSENEKQNIRDIFIPKNTKGKQEKENQKNKKKKKRRRWWWWWKKMKIRTGVVKATDMQSNAYWSQWISWARRASAVRRTIRMYRNASGVYHG